MPTPPLCPGQNFGTIAAVRFGKQGEMLLGYILWGRLGKKGNRPAIIFLPFFFSESRSGQMKMSRKRRVRLISTAALREPWRLGDRQWKNPRLRGRGELKLTGAGDFSIDGRRGAKAPAVRRSMEKS